MPEPDRPAVTVEIHEGLPTDEVLDAARTVYLAAFSQEPYGEGEDMADAFVTRVREYAVARRGVRLAIARVGLPDGTTGHTPVVGMVLAVTATPGTPWREAVAEVVGAARADEIFGDEAMEVVHVAVLPGHTGQGVGRALLLALEAQAPEPRGVLAALDHVPAALRLYESLGWQVVDANPERRRVIMTRRLGS